MIRDFQYHINRYLVDSVMSNNLVTVKDALEKGASIKTAVDHEFNPVLFCAKDSVMVKFLISQGADVDVVSRSFRETLLTSGAGVAGSEDIIKELLSAGANVNAINGCGQTALMVAAEKGHIEICKILLAAGADMTISREDRFDVLYYAIIFLQVKIVKLFLEKNISFKTGSDSPLFVALDIRSAGNEEKEESEKRTEIIKLLLEKEVDVNVRDKNDNTPLMFASTLGLFAIAGLLLEKGATINSCNEFGVSALAGAITYGKEEVALLLIEKGAHTKLRPKTIMTLAKRCRLRDVVSLLKKSET